MKTNLKPGDLLVFSAELETAPEVKIPTVKGIAYTGGLLPTKAGVEVVLDLEGLEIAPTVPLLANHENKVENKLGDIEVVAVDGNLVIDGKITATTFIAREIINQAKEGAKWELSVGVKVRTVEHLIEETTVNGKAWAVGTTVARTAELREISIIPIGADPGTFLEITAKANLEPKPETNMTKEVKKDTNIEASAQIDLQAERSRINEIIELCEGDIAVQTEAIEAGWTIDQTASALLKNLRSKRPTVNFSTPEPADHSKIVEAALMIRAGIDEDTVLKAVGEQAIEAGYKERSMSIKDAAKTCIQAAGGNVGLGFADSDIQAAFNTSLPGILGNVANKKLLQAFRAYDPVALKLCSVADLNDFKTTEIYSIADFGNLAKVGSDGKLTADKLIEGKGTNKLETLGKLVSLTRQQIINDDLGAFLRILQILGHRCARTIDQIFFKTLLANPVLADGKPLFSEDHSNLFDVTSNALGVDSLKSVVAAFLKQTDISGEPINTEAAYLLTPPELYFLGKELCESTYMIGGSARAGQNNPIANLMDVVQSPYLSAPGYEGSSATDYYIFADKDENPAIEMGFLKGHPEPTIESSAAEFDTLGYHWRCFYDLGCGVADHRGVAKVGTIPAETSS